MERAIERSRRTINAGVRLPRGAVVGRIDGSAIREVPHAPAAARRVVAEVFGEPDARSFAVRYWTGLIEPGYRQSPRFTLVFRSPAALRSMFLPPSELGLAEAFVSGDLDVEGDLNDAISLGPAIRERLRDPARLIRLLWCVSCLPASATSVVRDARASEHRGLGRRHVRARDAAAIRHHYDVGNEFYSQWLDRDMVYSCAYFESADASLDAAQAAKLDLICRKLRLHPGQRLLDIGCGWGALIRHAARHYGVAAVGITLSPAQQQVARERIAADGLTERCLVELRDYRDLAPLGSFDRISSVGMFEHVGPAELPRYFAAAQAALVPGGLFLNHGIVNLEGARPRTLASRIAARLWREGQFIDRYVFPDGDLAPLGAVIQAAEQNGLETRDVESLREHYALTLRHWGRRLEERKAHAIDVVGEAIYRTWRLYIAGSAHAFTTARISVIQQLLARPTVEGTVSIPGTRRDIYAPSPSRAVLSPLAASCR
jgi:cyclopropane-fatty-acyl-phospholipid synthase